MNVKAILENLCAYDKRNPDYVDLELEPGETKRKPCFCDNCFYRRTELATEILKLMPQIELAKEILKMGDGNEI